MRLLWSVDAWCASQRCCDLFTFSSAALRPTLTAAGRREQSWVAPRYSAFHQETLSTSEWNNAASRPLLCSFLGSSHSWAHSAPPLPTPQCALIGHSTLKAAEQDSHWNFAPHRCVSMQILPAVSIQPVFSEWLSLEQSADDFKWKILECSVQRVDGPYVYPSAPFEKNLCHRPLYTRATCYQLRELMLLWLTAIWYNNRGTFSPHKICLACILNLPSFLFWIKKIRNVALDYNRNAIWKNPITVITKVNMRAWCCESVVKSISKLMTVSDALLLPEACDWLHPSP